MNTREKTKEKEEERVGGERGKRRWEGRREVGSLAF